VKSPELQDSKVGWSLPIRRLFICRVISLASSNPGRRLASAALQSTRVKENGATADFAILSIAGLASGQRSFKAGTEPRRVRCSVNNFARSNHHGRWIPRFCRHSRRKYRRGAHSERGYVIGHVCDVDRLVDTPAGVSVMRIGLFLPALAIAGTLISPSALAESDAECLARWKAADLDADGAFTASKDSKDYAEVLAGQGSISRDAFLDQCKAGRFSGLKLPDNAAAGRDLGKGDLTGGPPLERADAEKRLKALGYSDIKLALDNDGIWRGTAIANQKAVNVERINPGLTG
jgi:hypothetical protein